MIIATTVFGGTFGRLLEAHQRSVAANCPGAEHRIYWADGPVQNNPDLPVHCTANTLKLQAWDWIAQNAEDDVVLIDADTLVLGDLSEAFGGFDVGITVRPGHYPINGGVLFVRPTEATRSFIRRWREANDRMYTDTDLARYGVDVYGGLNQAALVTAMTIDRSARIAKLPCSKWNSVDQTWEEFDADTRVLHIKGKLRWLALEGMRFREDIPLERCLQEWRKYDPEPLDAATANA